MYNYYLSLLGEIPEFLKPYLNTKSLQRLKNVGYLCGMDYASKDIYDFSEYISRYDHSLSVAMLIYYLTKNKLYTIAGLLHDIATPCFSHVIDYMNGDYINQESTEQMTEEIIFSDIDLCMNIIDDGLNIDKIINFKDIPIVDLPRPKLCADRIDGIILSSIAWSKKITKEDIYEIVNDLEIYGDEIGFKDEFVGLKVLKLNQITDELTHSKEDIYMMKLLAEITKLVIQRHSIPYNKLYYLDEVELFNYIKNIKDLEIEEKLYLFENIRKDQIPFDDETIVKKRVINPLVNNKRLKNE